MRAARFPGILILVFAFSLIGAACRERRPEPKLETHRTIPSQGESRAVVTIKMAAGELDVRGGAGGELMKGSFYYNRRPWEPRIDYQVSGGVSRLVVEQRRMGPAFGRVRNNWNVVCPGRSRRSCGWTSASEKPESTWTASPSPSSMSRWAGGMDLDLSGARNEGLTGQIEGGIGRAEILLPSDIGVRLRIEGGLGSIHAPGFIKDGETFRNEARGKTGASLDLAIEAGIGRIDLRMKNTRSFSF